MKKSLFMLALLMLAALPFAKAQVSVGDILCSDGQILTPSAYPSSGATAIGVVFYVDGTGQHGWAVALRDSATSVMWYYQYSGTGPDFSLSNFTTIHDAIYDLDGYQNTQVMRSLVGYGSTSLPAFYAVDFEHGWYLPAIGQINNLYGNLIEVNNSLLIAGGTIFPMNSNWTYWSSTEYGSGSAWYVSSNGGVSHASKYNRRSVRAVRNF